MILIIDNYDSFTYNLVQCVGNTTRNIKIIKNDELKINKIRMMDISHIILSPGPGNPKDSGVCLDIINQMSPTVPTLGICLGHQAIGYCHNAKINNSKNIVHGKTSIITHNNNSMLFKNIPNKFSATRYHSLAVDRKFKNDDINITSWSDDGEIMSIEHNIYPIYGIQFHPESILTEYGDSIINNFTRLVV